ncbi:MAG: glycosyltransferase family 9 protein [Kiritimatiellae bacterium]|nr:glycosyltransferase family 9 protein [Kiritimatiellia bacterium]
MASDPRILVLRGGALGDFILTLPALQALRKRWPRAYIELAGYSHIAHLAKDAGYADHILSLDRAEVARFFAINPVFTEWQRRWVSSFDFVINYLHDPDGSLNDNLRAAGARELLYASPLDLDGHATATFLKPLVSLALIDCDPVPRIPGRQEPATPDRCLGTTVIHPGSGSPRKNWPVENFMGLAGQLNTQDILFLTGEADVAVVEPIAAFVAEHGFWHLHHPHLSEVVHLFRSAGRYIGNDSGITHLAAACGVPTLAIFGPTDPAVWAPLGAHVTVIQAGQPAFGDLTVSRVMESLR